MTQEQLLHASLLHDELERLTRMRRGIQRTFQDYHILVESRPSNCNKPDQSDYFFANKEESTEIRRLLVAWVDGKIEALNKEIQQL